MCCGRWYNVQYLLVTTIIPPPLKEYELHPIESQYGLLNIAEALQFLHSGVRLMHGNITPEAIVVTGSGTWKLMGFNFSCYSQYQSEAQVKDGGREGRISEKRGRKGRREGGTEG